MSTIRQQIIALLLEQEMNVRDLSQTLSVMEKEVYPHLEHIGLTVARQGGKLLIDAGRAFQHLASASNLTVGRFSCRELWCQDRHANDDPSQPGRERPTDTARARYRHQSASWIRIPTLVLSHCIAKVAANVSVSTSVKANTNRSLNGAASGSTSTSSTS